MSLGVVLVFWAGGRRSTNVGERGGRAAGSTISAALSSVLLAGRREGTRPAVSARSARGLCVEHCTLNAYKALESFTVVKGKVLRWIVSKRSHTPSNADPERAKWAPTTFYVKDVLFNSD